MQGGKGLKRRMRMECWKRDRMDTRGETAQNSYPVYFASNQCFNWVIEGCLRPLASPDSGKRFTHISTPMPRIHSP
eukprot:1374515-Amorphochlora_amoeboformis.AAC.1